jgi:hypothetical protein
MMATRVKGRRGLIVPTATASAGQTPGKSGVVPAPPAAPGTIKFLREDMTWGVPVMDAFSAGGVQTTNATTTTLLSLTPQDGHAIRVMVYVLARQTDGSNVVGFTRSATFRRAGGTTTQVGVTTVIATEADAVPWTCTLDASGASARVRVTGALATTIDWHGYAHITICPVP